VAAMAEERFHFGFCFREFVLPNDQFPREPCRFDRGKPFENIERHASHAN
jgi:hypothetical protein